MILRYPVSQLFHFSQAPRARSYRQKLKRPKETQLFKLAQYIEAYPNTLRGQRYPSKYLSNYESFKSLPITKYCDYPFFTKKLSLKELVRYEPTSGSTSQRKWFPYTKGLLREFDNASSPWIYDILAQYPKVKKGRQYWSLSWVPNDLRDEGVRNDDTELLPWWKTLMLRSLMITNKGVEYLPTLEEYKLKTTLNLIQASDLSLLSLWSPTFLLTLKRDISDLKEEISSFLPDGRIKALIKEWNGQWSPEFTKAIWPKLSLISCWDQGHAAPFAKKIAQLFPHAILQGKGIWTTEGVISIPFQGSYPLAIDSHFYEFECCQTKKIFDSWELHEGMIVHPIITTGAELYRYKIDDRLLVTGHLHKTPCFQFLGRDQTVDITGEKLDFTLVSDLFRSIQDFYKTSPLTLFIDRTAEDLRYNLIIDEDREDLDDLAIFVECELMKIHHYQVARELGQLKHAGVKKVQCAHNFIEDIRLKKGVLAGDFKLDPITFI